jgi:hypothetical protein
MNDRNEDKIRKDRRYASLEVIPRDSLLKSFVDAQGRFVPRGRRKPLRHGRRLVHSGGLHRALRS